MDRLPKELPNAFATGVSGKLAFLDQPERRIEVPENLDARGF